MSVTDKLKKTKKKVEETAKKKAYSEKPGAKNPAKVSDLVKMTPTKAVKGQGQTVTKSVPKAKNVTSQTKTRKQEIQKKWGQQEERARSIGIDHVLGRSPLYTLQRDNAIGRTVQDRLDYNKYLRTQPRELSDEEKREEIRSRLNVLARQLKDAGQPLSSQDRNLSSRDQNLIRSAKTDYDEAREQGNRALMEAAHKRAEYIRKGYGYSGGTAGEDYISPSLSKEEIAMLTPEGQRNLKRVRMNLEDAVKSGDERKIAEAEAAAARIIGNNANRKEGFKKVDGYEGGNGQPRSKEPIMSYQDWEDRAYEGVYSVMSAIPGSILSVVETSNQAIENDFREKNWDYINDKANRLYEYKAKLELAKKGEGNPEWGTVAQLEQQVRIAEKAEKMRTSGTIVDPNLPGQTLMRKSMDAQQKFMEGRTGADKLLASAALSMGQMIPALAASAIPGVGPAVGAGIMGAQAAGSKSYELNERGVDPAEAQLRGVTSGVIESLTEKVPISNLLKVVKAGGGSSLLKTMAKQAGIEATEESISYALNNAADVAFKDPEAKFSMKDLLESAAVGAISGGALSGGGALLGRAVTRNAGTSGQVVTPVRQEQKETRADTERQIRDQAAAMLTGEAAVPETVRQTERTTQRDVPVAEILERAPVSGNVQQEMRSEAQTASSSQNAVPVKTVNPTRIEVREQAGSPAMEPNSQVRQVLGQAQTSMLTRMANTLGDSGSKAIMAAWDNNGNPGQYAADFVRVYNRALSGTTVGRIQAPASLTDAQVMAAYTAGQNDRMASLEQEKVNAQQAEVAGRNTAVYATVDGSEAGLVYDDYVRDVMDRDTAESLTTVAKHLGLRVQMVDSVAGGMANADIQGSVVQIEKNNPNPVRSLFGHEMTHRVQQLAPESYRAFRDYVMQSEKAHADVQRKIAEYRKAGVELSSEAAMDEIAADYAGEMIEDQNLLKRFIENNRSNQSLLHRFLTAVKDMARKLTGSYQKQANDAVALLEKAVGDASRQAGKLQANKNTARKGGEIRTAGGLRYSIKMSFAEQVDAALKRNLDENTAVYVADTPKILQDLGLKNYPMLMTQKHIRDINHKKSPKNSHWHGISKGKIKKLPELISKPAIIIESATISGDIVLVTSEVDQDKLPVIVSIHPNGRGHYNRAEIASNFITSMYGRNGFKNFIDTAIKENRILYNDKKRTQELFSRPGLQLPNSLNKDGFFKGTIAQQDEAVKKRFSLKDSSGRTLSEGQREYFKNSKAVDEDGNLLVMYHGTPKGGFTTFRDWSYLTESEKYAKRYADRNTGETVYEVYANITNPFDTRLKACRDLWREEFFGNYSRTELQETGLPDWTDGYDLAEWIEENDYDYDAILLDEGADPSPSGDVVERGVSYVVRSSEQIKNVDNDNPTTDPDIRFSLKGSDDYNLRKLQAENEILRERVDYWKGQTKRTERVTTDKKAVAKTARDLIRQYGADIEVSDIQGDLQSLYDYMASGKDGESDLTYAAARERAEGIADKLISNAVEREDELYQQYSDLRQFLKDTKLTVSEADSKGITDYADFRRRNFGHFKLSKGERTNVDMVYKEMSERWPEFFDEEREGTISDQLYQIESVLDKVYQITEYNPFDMYTSQAVSGAANEILERFFDLPQTRATFADRQAAKLDREKAAGRRRLQEERERKDAKLEELRRKNRERVDKVIQKERERREKDLGRLKDQYQARDAAGRERRKARELRAKILRHTKNLSTKLLRPNDKQHIPENLRSAVANVLNSINLESDYAYDPDTLHEVIRKDGKSGGLTGKHVQAGKGTPTKRTQAFQELRLAYENILSEADQQIVVDPDLLANISELEAMKDTPLGSLNLSQLTTVWNTLKAVEASISTANKIFGASKFETIREVAEGLKADNGGKRDRGDYRGPIGAMDKLINAGMLTPDSYFHRLGKTGEELFRMLRRAQDKHITIMQEAQEYTAGVIGKTNVRKLEKEVHHFELDGQAVDMTTAQIMSLYELTKRKQAQEHIMVGGIRVDSVNKGIKRTSMSDAVRVTPEQVSEIVSALTEEQISIADGLQKFMGGRLAQLGNEASMEVYGYEKFKEKNYFPIKVDSNQTITDQAKDAAAATISGRGFTKGTKPHANNAVMIRNIFDVYADHVTDMATYSAWLGPMENLQRVFNFKFRDADGNVTGTVKGLIHRIFGNNGQAYWKKLTDDLNNGVHGVNDNPFQALIGNYKASAIGANIRVFIQQPTSILRALDTISPGDFVAGLVKSNPGTWRKVKKYAPIAVWKDWGYFDADTGRQMKSVLFGDDSKLSKVNNALMAPAGAMDSLAWSHVWNALEVETGRKHKDLEKGSDAFYQKVAERFNEVIDHSQVVDGVLQRSQLMRSADGVNKMATSFMAEPTKIFNMFTTAAYDLRKSQDIAVRRQAGKTMARTSVSLVISFVANAAAQSLIDALRDDDKDEEYWEKFFQAFVGLEGDEESKLDSFKSVVGGNMVSSFNPFTYLPFVKDVVSLVEGYDVNRMDMESISKVILAMGQCCMSLFGDGKMTKQNAVINLIGELSRLLGTPVANIKRDAVAIINTWLNGTHNYKLQYEVAKFMYRIENKNNKNMFLDIAYMAWRDGDKDTFLEISQDLMDAFGDDVNGETIERAMRKRMENQTEEDANFQADQTLMDLVGLLPSYEEEEEEEAEFSAKNLNAKQYEQYSTQRASSYREYENAVTSNPVWATLDDEAKDKVISAMWKYAGQTALEEASDGEFTITESGVLKARAVAESGVDVGTFFIMKGVADAQEGVKTVDGVTISDSASYNKFKALRDSGVMDNLSAAQKEKVYDALEISSKVRSMNESALNQLGQDIEAKKNEPSVFSVLGEDKTDFVKEFYDTCDSFSSSYDGNGKPIKGQGKQDKIIAEINKYSNLTRKEKSALYHMFYESDRNNPWA